MYIIENAEIYTEVEKRVKKTSLLVKENSIYSMKRSFVRERKLKMNVSSFVMTPTHVMLDSSSPYSTFEMLKQAFIENFLLKGCHTIISPFNVQYENEFEEKLRKKRTSLLSSPIDYILAVSIPIKKLTTNLIRKCKKSKVPIIFLELSNESDITSIPWGWIRDSMFPYNPILVPKCQSENENLNRKILKIWKEVLGNENIPFISDEISEKSPIPVWILKKFGLYPKRGDLHIGGEINYNLYFKNKKVAVQEGFHYDYDSLAIMVHRGLVTTIGHVATFRPGFGEEIIIHRTSLFV